MDLFFQLGLVSEIIITNMLIFYRNATPKYSLRKTISIIFIFSVFLSIGGLFFLKQFSFFGNGNATFTMLGFLYLPILNYLFYEKYRDIFFIMCYAWIYTLLAYSLSVQIGYIFQDYGRFLIIFLTQTLFFHMYISIHVSIY